MNVTYFIRGESFNMKSHWFTQSCISQDHEVNTLIKDCAMDFYENHNPESSAFPAEISVCLGNKEFGRCSVELCFKPVFEIL